MNTLTSLFLSQSYQDAWDDYIRSLHRENFAHWDYVILTASNTHQAISFRKQIDRRIKEGLLSPYTEFVVITDPGGKRVGSGGATLNVIAFLAKKDIHFFEKCILVIHSGGDSKRVPQYSAMGKLFSPVPHALPNGYSSTLFDEFMIASSGIPARIRSGMLLLSGDVLLLFNCLQIDYSGNNAAAISFKENVKTGQNHGVYLVGEDGNVAEFLHKQSVETLIHKGAVNQHQCVDIDTGAVIFSKYILRALYGLISENGIYREDKFHDFVNEKIRLSLYGDFLYPLGSKATLEGFYKENPEGEYCQELLDARKAVWEVLHPFTLKLIRISPAKFIHFGTTEEILHLLSQDINKYKYFSWGRHINSHIGVENVSAYNSILSKGAVCGENSYLEVSYVHSNAKVGKNVVLSYIDIHDEEIPDNVVLHGLKQKDGKFVVRIYGVNDNIKGRLKENCIFLGSTLKKFIQNYNIRTEELWNGDSDSLWEAKLYPICDTIVEAVQSALNVYALVHGKGDIESWRRSNRKSLSSGFIDADMDALMAWERRMYELICMEQLRYAILKGQDVEETRQILNTQNLTKIQREWLETQIKRAGFQDKIRLYYYVGKGLGGTRGERYIEKCFQTIQDGVLQGVMKTLEKIYNYRICKEEHRVSLPLRVNWGGGWSDTPPHCNECGGTVLNAAISLQNHYPVQVYLHKLKEKKIVFDSKDMGIHEEFTEIAELQNCGDPYDPLVLQKAALLACGIIPMQGGNLTEILNHLGGGMIMRTEVVDIPKGSGLGTSSILAGACIKALFEFLGREYTEEDLYEYVLCMEQLMSTGGGWQDQVGGLSSGIKYITSVPSMQQKLKVQKVSLSQETKQELNERFALIYTGQRRLARNLLRDVVGRYIGNVAEAKEALQEIQKLAVLMRFELERGNVDEFANLLSKHWEFSKQLDAGSSNTCIEQIFYSIEDLIDGRMICGAGGGGFLQVIMKRGVKPQDISNRLQQVFQDSGVDIWDCKLLLEDSLL